MENCHNYRERISALIDGALSEQERLDLLEHMAECSACQQYFDDQTAIHEALTALEADAPAGFADAVMARVRETAQDAPRSKTVAFPHWKRLAATAACCVLTLLGVMTMQTEEDAKLDAVVRNQTSYSLAQSEPSVADDAAAVAVVTADAVQGKSNTSAPAEGAPACAERRVQACTLTTASSLAVQWVEDTLADTEETAEGYPLTEEQFLTLQKLLEESGESYSCSEGEVGGWYLMLTVS